MSHSEWLNSGWKRGLKWRTHSWWNENAHSSSEWARWLVRGLCASSSLLFHFPFQKMLQLLLTNFCWLPIAYKRLIIINKRRNDCYERSHCFYQEQPNEKHFPMKLITCTNSIITAESWHLNLTVYLAVRDKIDKIIDFFNAASCDEQMMRRKYFEKTERFQWAENPRKSESNLHCQRSLEQCSWREWLND